MSEFDMGRCGLPPRPMLFPACPADAFAPAFPLLLPQT